MNKHRADSLLKSLGGVAGVLVLLAILIAVNVIVRNVRLRADLTQDNLFTLSEGSRNILENLENKVTLKLFFSRSSTSVPIYLKNHAKQVEDFLHEYKMAGRGKILLETHDPKPDTDAEEWAHKYGLRAQNVEMFGTPIFFGLVAVMGDNEGSIPVFDPRAQGTLEYDITRLIHRVAHPEKPVIGVISSLPVLGFQMPQMNRMPGQPPPQSQPPWINFKYLKEDFDVREITSTADAIDEDVDALIVVHPKDVSPATLYAIDQFILGGGHVLAFVDPLCRTDLQSAAANPYQMPQASSNMKELFAAWGVGYDPGKVISDNRASTRVRGQNNQIEDTPVLLSLRGDNINTEETLTTQLENVLLAFVGSFSDETAEDLTFTPLLKSNEGSGQVDAMTAQFGGNALRNAVKEGSGIALNLAVRLQGKFKTGFPDGPPDSGDAEGKPAPVGSSLKEGESTVILVADSDMVSDMFCFENMGFFGYRRINDNADFFANATEQAAGNSDLITIRSRGTSQRPFDRVLELEHDARMRFQAEADELEGKLRETQQEINELLRGKGTNQRIIMSREIQDKIAKARKEEIATKLKLREVRKSLRRDIEVLGFKVKSINILLMPILIALTGVAFSLYRHRKR